MDILRIFLDDEIDYNKLLVLRTLAYFLHPGESHGIGHSFLKKYLKTISEFLPPLNALSDEEWHPLLTSTQINIKMQKILDHRILTISLETGGVLYNIQNLVKEISPGNAYIEVLPADCNDAGDRNPVIVPFRMDDAVRVLPGWIASQSIEEMLREFIEECIHGELPPVAETCLALARSLRYLMLLDFDGR